MITFSGAQYKSSESFHLQGGQQRVTVDARNGTETCEGRDMRVYLTRTGSDASTEDMSATYGRTVGYWHAGPGNYYLETITGFCDFTIVLEEQRS